MSRSDTSESRSGRTTTRMRDAGRAGRGREGGPQPGTGAARRGRDRQDRVARVRRSTARRAAGSAGPRGSSRRWSSPTPACTSSAARTWSGWTGCPAPQRDALGTAFGLRPGTAARPLPRGPGRPHPAQQVAEELPLVCVVDDAQWLDRASMQTLEFVARRLRAEPVAMVFAVRESDEEPEPGRAAGARGARADGRDAEELLDASVPGSARRGGPRPDPGREPRQSARAPRAAARSVGDRAGVRGRQRRGRHSPGPPPRTGLPPQAGALAREQSRRLLLVAAAEPVGDVPLLWRAVQRLGIRPEAAGAAEAAGLIELRDRARFRHPLVRSAVYRSATPAERREVHRALADVTDPDVDPDRRAWHRACAALHPDEAVAAELERVGGPRARPRRRGGRGGLPRAVRCADARPGAAGAACARRRAAQGARRGVRRRLGAPGGRSGGAARRRRAGARRPGARGDLLRHEPRQRRTAAAPGGRRAGSNRSTRGSRGTPTSTRSPRRCSPDASPSGPGARHVAEAVRKAPPPQPPRKGDALLDGLAVLFTDGYARAAPAVASCGRRRSPARS